MTSVVSSMRTLRAELPRRLLRLTMMLLLLAGCSAIAEVATSRRPLDTYELTPLPARSMTSQGSRHLVIEVPTSSGALATERIAVKPNAFEVSYLPGARWVDAAPEHLQLLLARSIGGTGAFALVSVQGARPDPDWFLETDLQAFQVELDASGAPRATIRLRAVLVSDRDRRIRAARTFERSSAATTTEVGAVVPAFDRAANALLLDVTNWTIANAR
jgi:cholesterol transport system auxiliary component